jgi:hypothetical protein
MCQREVSEKGWKVRNARCLPFVPAFDVDGAICSVRAWRCVRFNKKYAEKLERIATGKREREEKAEKSVQPSGPRSNPFSVSARSNTDWRGLTRGDL